MKFFIICLVALCTLSMFSQKKHEDGLFKEYYKNGNLRIEGVYKNNQKIGRWKYYFENGQLEKDNVLLKNGNWSGYERTYSKDGNLISETQPDANGNFVQKHFFADGSIKRAFILKPFKDGKRYLKSGPYKEFYNNGTLKVECSLSENKLTGLWKRYYPTSELEWEVNYINNFKQGPYKQFYKDGKIKLEGVNDLNQKNGTENHFDSNGSKTQTLKYKKGALKNSSKNSNEEIVDIPDGILEKPPVYPGCEDELGTAAIKKCLSLKVSEFVVKRFNTTFGSDTNLEGEQKIYVIFKIDKTGHVTGVRARAEHKAFEAEAIRVLALLPQMTPGYQYGKPVIVPFSLPIVFKI